MNPSSIQHLQNNDDESRNSFRPVYIPRRRAKNSTAASIADTTSTTTANKCVLLERKVTKNHRNRSSPISADAEFAVSNGDGISSAAPIEMTNPNSGYDAAITTFDCENKKEQNRGMMVQKVENLLKFSSSKELSSLFELKEYESLRNTLETNKQSYVNEYMDEQDHNDWGGATVVRDTFTNSFSSSSKGGTKVESAMSSDRIDEVGDLVNGKVTAIRRNETIGQKLLRSFGWKGRDVAYAKSFNQDGIYGSAHGEKTFPVNSSLTNESDDDNRPEMQFLESRNIRKILLHSMAGNSYNMPEPKYNTCGLGYSAFANAPEFEKYHHQRSRKPIGRNNNVYVLSNSVLNCNNGSGSSSDGDTNDKKRTKRRRHDRWFDSSSHVGGVFVNGVEDIVGTKSSTGFALHDDDDDGVYDDDNTGNFTSSHRNCVRSDTRTILSTTHSTTLDPVSNSIVIFNQELQKSNLMTPLSERNPFVKGWKVNQDRYDTVLYDDSDSDPEDFSKGKLSLLSPKSHDSRNRKNDNRKLGVSLKSLLSSWTNTSDSNKTGATKWQDPITSDGLALMDGFDLVIEERETCSASIDDTMRTIHQPPNSHGHISQIRFVGPALPSGYDLNLHSFGPLENPLGIHALVDSNQNRNTKQEDSLQSFSQSYPSLLKSMEENTLLKQRSIIQLQTIKVGNVNTHTIPDIQPASQPIFLQKTRMIEGIAESMNNRFTSSASIDRQQYNSVEISLSDGLSCREDIVATKEEAKKAASKCFKNQIAFKNLRNTSEPVVKATRTSAFFVPEPLLRKRFRVASSFKSNPTIHHSVNALSTNAEFQDAIMRRVNLAASVDAAAQFCFERHSVDDKASLPFDEQQNLYREEAKRIVQKLLSGSNSTDGSADLTFSSEGIRENRPSFSTYQSIFRQPMERQDADKAASNVLSSGRDDVESMIPNMLKTPASGNKSLDSFQCTKSKGAVLNENLDDIQSESRSSIRKKLQTVSLMNHDVLDTTCEERISTRDHGVVPIVKCRHRKKLKWKNQGRDDRERRGKSSKKSKKRKDKY